MINCSNPNLLKDTSFVYLGTPWFDWILILIPCTYTVNIVHMEVGEGACFPYMSSITDKLVNVQDYWWNFSTSIDKLRFYNLHFLSHNLQRFINIIRKISTSFINNVNCVAVLIKSYHWITKMLLVQTNNKLLMSELLQSNLSST